jgi:alanine dehydrogenase
MEKYFSSGYSFEKESLLPQEEMLEVAKKEKKLTIGIPKDNSDNEFRVPLTPEAVEILVENNHEVLIESNAGAGANYNNKDYSESGGFIVNNREEIYKADIILKIAPFDEDEINLFKGNQLVISSLHINGQTKKHLEALIKKKVTAVACENIKDEHDIYPVERSMSAISGSTSIMVAAEYLSNTFNGKGVMLGGITGITPAEVVILGAGTAAEFAIRAALGLGANVKIFDNSLYRLRELQNKINKRLYTSVYHQRVLIKALRSTDVLIGTRPLDENKRHFFITDNMVKEMKKGSVIVDLTLDQGGCIETSEPRTHKNPVITKHGVIHYCVPNLQSKVARTASIALSNIFSPLILNIGASGGITKHLKKDNGLRNGIYIYNGILTNNKLGNLYNIPSQSIDLLLAAF